VVVAASTRRGALHHYRINRHHRRGAERGLGGERLAGLGGSVPPSSTAGGQVPAELSSPRSPSWRSATGEVRSRRVRRRAAPSPTPSASSLHLQWRKYQAPAWIERLRYLLGNWAKTLHPRNVGSAKFVRMFVNHLRGGRFCFVRRKHS
jgi:hypothetical protein